MTASERDKMLMEMHAEIKVISTTLEKQDKALYGNGQPGVIEKVQKLQDWHDHAESFKAKYGSVIGWIVTTAIAIFAVFKPHEN